jgi:hypothetical protein
MLWVSTWPRYQKKALGEGVGEGKANPILYRVDGEIGRFRFTTYRREVGGAVVIDSGRGLFPSLSGEQWYLTRGFKEMAMFYGVVKRPYREATAVINRLRYVEEAPPLRSLRAQSEREGAKLQAHIAVKSAAILAAHGVGKAEGAEVQEPRFGVQEMAQKAAAEVTAALAACTEDAEARRWRPTRCRMKSRGRASTSP